MEWQGRNNVWCAGTVCENLPVFTKKCFFVVVFLLVHALKKDWGCFKYYIWLLEDVFLSLVSWVNISFEDQSNVGNFGIFIPSYWASAVLLK